MGMTRLRNVGIHTIQVNIVREDMYLCARRHVPDVVICERRSISVLRSEYCSGYILPQGQSIQRVVFKQLLNTIDLPTPNISDCIVFIVQPPHLGPGLSFELTRR